MKPPTQPFEWAQVPPLQHAPVSWTDRRVVSFVAMQLSAESLDRSLTLGR